MNKAKYRVYYKNEDDKFEFEATFKHEHDARSWISFNNFLLRPEDHFHYRITFNSKILYDNEIGYDRDKGD